MTAAVVRLAGRLRRQGNEWLGRLADWLRRERWDRRDDWPY